MSITILFIELEIIGFQVLLWVSMLLFNFIDRNTIKLILSEVNTQLVFVFIICFSYCFGILIDRIADSVFSPWNQKLKDKVIPKPPVNIGTMRYIIVQDNKALNDFLDYTRSRIRICRASAINFPLITIFISVLGVSRKYLVQNSKLLLIILGLGLFFTICSVLSWRNLTIRHLDLTRTMYINKDRG